MGTAFQMGPNGALLNGDCIERLRALPDNSVHAVITDPPYGLSDHRPEEVVACLRAWLDGQPYTPKARGGFMGKGWDAWVPGPEVWRECLRVLRPGGHLLAFAGTRSMDLMCMAVRLAGFELRDSIGWAHEDGGGAPLVAWTYGQGFPKSMDVSKAIDKVAGAEREVVGVKPGHEGFAGRGNLSSVQSLKGTLGGEGGFARPWMEDPKAVERYHMQTAPATDAAKQWSGWGTALKPAWEPIILARKPLGGTVAANVVEHGTGGLNIDGCRVEGEGGMKWESPRGGIWSTDSEAQARLVPNTQGRFPANLIHDGSPEVLAAFPEAPGQQGDLKGHANERQSPNGTFGKMAPANDHPARQDSTTSAARFFYCAKASPRDRDEGLPKGSNKHPTVKPTNLMRYLCRLVTPPNGIVLDPFMGSGSTGKAAVMEGFRFVGIERDQESFRTAQARVKAAVAATQSQPAAA